MANTLPDDVSATTCPVEPPTAENTVEATGTPAAPAVTVINVVVHAAEADVLDARTTVPAEPTMMADDAPLDDGDVIQTACNVDVAADQDHTNT